MTLHRRHVQRYMAQHFNSSQAWLAPSGGGSLVGRLVCPADVRRLQHVFRGGGILLRGHHHHPRNSGKQLKSRCSLSFGSGEQLHRRLRLRSLFLSNAYSSCRAFFFPRQQTAVGRHRFVSFFVLPRFQSPDACVVEARVNILPRRAGLIGAYRMCLGNDRSDPVNPPYHVLAPLPPELFFFAYVFLRSRWQIPKSSSAPSRRPFGQSGVSSVCNVQPRIESGFLRSISKRYLIARNVAKSASSTAVVLTVHRKTLYVNRPSIHTAA